MATLTHWVKRLYEHAVFFIFISYPKNEKANLNKE
jgi:hypothetical protein